MATDGVHEVAGKASAEQGVVFLDGPDGVAVTITAAAAEAMGKDLIRAAAEARQQMSNSQSSDTLHG